MNIYALATSIGKSGIAIIRVSGENLSSIFEAFKINPQIKPRYASLIGLYSNIDNELIDNAIVISFESPNSFTGENILEFHVHGSRAIINQILDCLSIIPNTRLAEPGEFSKRAFLNNKLDLCQAEGLEDLINSETTIQAKQALRQISGELSNLYLNWRNRILEILSIIEAFIDFPDEDLPNNILDKINNDIYSLKEEILSHIDDKRGQIIRDGIVIAIIGAPNVGKSSLLNFLAKKDVAIVSDIAGTTRDIIEVSLNIAGIPVTLADTAGLRESEDLIEIEGIKRAKQKLEEADLSIAIFDSTKLPFLDQETMKYVDKDTIMLFNKIDIATHIEQNNFQNSINISLLNGYGTEKIIANLESLVQNYNICSNTPYLTRIRYRENLISCIFFLDKFSFDTDIELAAEELRSAAFSIGKITGKINVDDILEKIFSSFCIGK